MSRKISKRIKIPGTNIYFPEPADTRECFSCESSIPIGEGDHICEKSHKMVICEYEPTDYFGRCPDRKHSQEELDFIEKYFKKPGEFGTEEQPVPHKKKKNKKRHKKHNTNNPNNTPSNNVTSQITNNTERNDDEKK